MRDACGRLETTRTTGGLSAQTACWVPESPVGRGTSSRALIARVCTLLRGGSVGDRRHTGHLRGTTMMRTADLRRAKQEAYAADLRAQIASKNALQADNADTW